MPDNATPLILLTRPAAQGGRFAAELRAVVDDRARILLSPMQEIVLLDLPDLPKNASLILTSENGVRAYRAGGGAPGRRAFCVGNRTAAAARGAGLRALSAGGAAGELLSLIRQQAPMDPLVHLHGRHVRGQIAETLRTEGFNATGHIVYDQRSLPLSDAAIAGLVSPGRVIVPLFSPRSAALFGEALEESMRPEILCISAATRAALPAPLQPLARVSDAPTSAAMLNAIARQLSP